MRKAFRLFVIIVCVLFFLWTFFRLFQGDLGAGIALAGMLGSPFRTTRKMKVPMHSRQGHRERSFQKFAVLICALGIAVFILAILVDEFNRFGLLP